MGCPREFDLNGALDRAIEVFWRNGYEGSSIADLTEAMGINPPSLYAAFGNKEGLFRQALDRYVEQRAGYWETALAAPTARGMVEGLLRGCADFLSQKCNPPGCLFVRSAASCSEATGDIRRALTARRAQAEARVRQRLEQARLDGELPAQLNPADYTRYVLALLEGMCMRATAGAGGEELHKVADMGLQIWPQPADTAILAEADG
jgi:AcrR family transcriptional regulator